MKIHRIVQSCFKIELKDKILYFDPFRIPKDSEKADIIFISHPHYDHYSIGSMNVIMKDDTIVICPKQCKKILKKWKARGLNPGEQVEIDGLNIKGISAYTRFLHNKDLNWLGYVIDDGTKRIYHAGDTYFFPEMDELLELDFAFLPIGGVYTMSFKGAIETAKTINAKNVIPMHERKKNLDEFEKILKIKLPNTNVIKLMKNQSYSKGIGQTQPVYSEISQENDKFRNGKVYSKKDFLLFLIFSFCLTWIFSLPVIISRLNGYSPYLIPILGSFTPYLLSFFELMAFLSPLISSFLATFIIDGIDGAKSLWKRMWNYNIKGSMGKGGFMLILTIFSVSFINSQLIDSIFNLENITELKWLTVPWIIPLAFLNIFIGAIGQEVGWRGYALDMVQRKWLNKGVTLSTWYKNKGAFFYSSVLIGTLWGLTWFPCMVLGRMPELIYDTVGFFIAIGLTCACTILASIGLNLLYNSSGKNILAVVSFHATPMFILFLFLA